jgi:ribosomal protein S18 acetylase RimI-like enzyme
LNQYKSSIRLATASDHAAISDCIDRAYSKYIDRLVKKPAPMLADYSGLIDQQVIYVIGDERAVHAVMVLFRESNHMYLGNLAVKPAYQKHGLGSAMMRFAEEQTVANGLREIRLFTNVLMTENLDYYSKIGYREYDRRTEDGYDRVFMKKDW